MKYVTTVEDHSYEIEINSEREITIDGQTLAVDFQSMAGQPVFSLIVDGRSYEAYVYPTDAGLQVMLGGRLYLVAVEDERQRRLRQATHGPEVARGELLLKAPMPGLVVAIPVQDGQSVVRGDDLIILESMKMQNELKAPRDGLVSRIRVKTGDRVDQNQVLLVLT